MRLAQGKAKEAKEAYHAAVQSFSCAGRRGGIAVTLDDPPLNLIGPTFAEDLIALIQEAEVSQHIAW